MASSGTAKDLRTIRRVLAVTGFSSESVGGLLQARAIATMLGAELHIAHAIESISAAAEAAVPGLAETHQRQAHEDLEAFANAHGVGAGATLHVVSGEPSTALLTLHNKIGADLLVLGRYGKGGLKRGSIGSVAAALVRKNPTPTLVVEPTHRGAFTRIGVATAFDDTSWVEIARARTLAQHFGIGEVVLLHAYELPHGYHRIMSYEQAIEKLGAVSKERADQFIKKTDAAGGKVRSVIVEGDAASRLPELIAEEKVDLLVMSTHWRTAAAQALLGHTTERVLKRVDCSVWAETCPELVQDFGDAMKRILG
ncbi:MAG: universal stress protein [Phycisphaerales bacterium]|jgi:nucleotide-binding universal stress UspA family protein|nr:universal stress protein [Phycisphaerales bacterium]